MRHALRPVPVFAIALALAATAGPAAAAGSPRAAVSAYLGTWNTGDLADLDAVVSEDFQRHARPGESPGSPAELADLVRRVRTNFDHVRVEVDEMLCEGERCALTGHFIGRLPGTDRGVRMQMTAFYRTTAGRVAEEWVVANQLPSMFGLGYVVVPPSTKVLTEEGGPGAESASAAGEAPPPFFSSAGSGASGAAAAAPPPPTEPATVGRPGTGPAAETAAHRLVRDYLRVWSTGAVDTLEDLVTPDFRRSDWNGHVASRQELAERIMEDREILSGLTWQVEDLVVDGDRAAARLVERATWAATGDVIAVPVHAFFSIEGGRLASEFPLGDHVRFLESLGHRVVEPGVKTEQPPVKGPPPPAFDTAAALAALDAAAAELSAAAPAAAAVVTVTSRSLGRLAVDGRPLGVTAPGHTVEFRLPRGAHLVTLHSLGDRPLGSERFELGRGDRRELVMGPPGRLFADLANRVSEDLTTGLLWTLVDNGEDLTWDEAVAYCEELELAGHDDWRLPDIRELLPLYDPDSPKNWRTLPGVELTSCCPWSANRHNEAMAWGFVSYKGGRYLRFTSFRRYQRAVCVRALW